MNKSELITNMAYKSGLSKKDTEKALKALIDSVEETLVGGDKVQLVGFGTFEVKKREARNGINPKTKESIKIAACNVPIFKAGSELRSKVK